MAELPDWTPFDPSAPPALPDLDDGPGRVVTVVATFRATSLGWAGRVAADLASGWSAGGHKVVLADGGLVEPQLHDVFGEANAEGVTDAVVFGASVRRVARPVREGSYFLVSAGTAVADPGSVLTSRRWRRLCDGFRRAGVTLVVFVSPDEPGLPWALETASDIVVLAAPDEDVTSLVAGSDDAVRAVVGVAADEPMAGQTTAEPPAPEATEMAPPPEPADVEDTAPPEAAAAVTAPPPDEAQAGPQHGDTEPGAELPAWSAEARRQAALRDSGEASHAAPTEVQVAETRRKNRTVLVLLIVVLAIVAAAALGLVDIPGITPAGARGTPAQDLTPVATSVPQPEVTGPVAYSVAVAAFQDWSVATGRAAQLQATYGGLFITVPVLINGSVFHRLLAGPAADSAEAGALRRRLGGEPALNAADLVVRSTPLAFRLDEERDLTAARETADRLRAAEIPAYVLAVEYADGAVRYRVYAGAYATEAEAEYLSHRLAENGLADTVLQPRTGRLPS